MHSSWLVSGLRTAACLLALGVCAALLGCGDEVVDTPPPPPPPNGVEVQANTRALLVGVTRYPNLQGKDLKGPANDVESLRYTLQAYLGVQDITVLTEDQDDAHKPDYANIKRELTTLADKTKKGDRIIFHFSGHGSRIKSNDPDERDGQDELMLARDLVSWSGAGKLQNAIRDDEMREWSQEVSKKGATVWMIFDCCHAGTMSRGPGEISRHITPEDLGVPEDYQPEPSAAPPASSEEASSDAEQGKIVSFYAVPEQDRAKELAFPRTGAREYKYYGLMTYALTRAIQRYGGGLTFAELERHMLTECSQVPHDQRPWADGNKRLYLAKEGMGQPLLMLEKHEDGTLRLKAGRLRGFSEGTIVTAYAKGKAGDANAIVGRARIVKAGFLDAVCEVVEEEAGTPTPSIDDLHELPVRVTTAVAGDLRVPIHVCDDQRRHLPEASYPPELKALLADRERQFRVVPLVQAGWLLQQEGPDWFLEPSGAGQDAHRVPFAARDLEPALANLFRVHTLLEIARGEQVAARLPDGLLVEGVLTGRQGTEPAGKLAVGSDPDEKIATLKDGDVLTPGELLQLRLRNQTFEPIDVTILGIDAQLGVYVMFPNRGGDPRIEGGGTKLLVLPGEKQSVPLADDAMGTEYLLVLAVPRPKQGDVDAERIDFTGLERNPISKSRGKGNTSAISQMLSAMAFGESTSRGKGATRADPEGLCVRLISYQNRWGALSVPSAIKSTGVAVPAEIRQARGPTTAPAGGPPTPWFVGTKIAKAADGEDMAPAVITWDDDATWIYIDADGDAGIAEKDVEALAAGIADGSLDVEMVVRLSDDLRMAWYAKGRGADPFTLVLAEPGTPDGTVIEYERHRDGGWNQRIRSGHWLGTANLGSTFDVRTRVTKRLHIFRKR
jgi:hypothetical protein